MNPTEGIKLRLIETRTKTYDANQTRGPKTAFPTKHPRPTVWRPEPTGLTRAELRQIVLDTLG